MGSELLELLDTLRFANDAGAAGGMVNEFKKFENLQLIENKQNNRYLGSWLAGRGRLVRSR